MRSPPLAAMRAALVRGERVACEVCEATGGRVSGQGVVGSGVVVGGLEDGDWGYGASGEEGGEMGKVGAQDGCQLVRPFCG